jgi:hypothetical protein
MSIVVLEKKFQRNTSGFKAENQKFPAAISCFPASHSKCLWTISLDATVVVPISKYQELLRLDQVMI